MALFSRQKSLRRSSVQQQRNRYMSTTLSSFVVSRACEVGDWSYACTQKEKRDHNRRWGTLLTTIAVRPRRVAEIQSEVCFSARLLLT